MVSWKINIACLAHEFLAQVPWAQSKPSLSLQTLQKNRRLLQRKRHFETELSGRLTVLWWLRIGHVVQNEQIVVSLDWQEWFSCKGRKRKIFCCWLILSFQQQIWKFHVAIWQTTLEKIKIFTSSEEKNNSIQVFCYYGVKVFNVA